MCIYKNVILFRSFEKQRSIKVNRRKIIRGKLLRNNIVTYCYILKLTYPFITLKNFILPQ